MPTLPSMSLMNLSKYLTSTVCVSPFTEMQRPNMATWKTLLERHTWCHALISHPKNDRGAYFFLV